MAEAIAHARHDPLRVAAALDRGARLGPLLELCGRCAVLYRDLVSLKAALPGGALPIRPRAFTLHEDDARRLRPRGWRAWWSALGSARDTITKPLAVGFTTLGLAGLLLTALPALPMGAGAATGPESAAMGADRAAASLAPNAQAPDTLASGSGQETGTVTSAQETPATLLLSVGLLVAGGSLFVARRVAVRSRPVR